MPPKLKAILSAGIIAGTVDILAAIIVYALVLDVTTAQKILQSVAAGIYGKPAHAGGMSTALTGLALHFAIALIFATIFVLLYPFLRKLLPNKYACGIFYGCLVWLAMNYIVLPVSAVGHAPKLDWKYTPISLIIIIICIGIPVSVITAGIFKKDSAGAI